MTLTARVERGGAWADFESYAGLSSSGTGGPEKWGASPQNDVPGLVLCGFPPSIELRAAQCSP